MQDFRRFYIEGAWVAPDRSADAPVIDPATGEQVAVISLGGAADVERAVAAARRALPAWSRSGLDERKALLARILDVYRRRYEEVAQAISMELGAPIAFARRSQTRLGIGHLTTALELLDRYPFVEDRDGMRLLREPVGVCALITPWNWPINQIACKVAPALAAGCTMVLKPSEIAPLSAQIFTEILDEAGVPPGVFNLVNGDGPTVGQALAAHPQVDMVSFTGSTRAGITVAQVAAPTVKRVHQELGGKSPNIVLDAGVLERAVAECVRECFSNSGQSCNAPSRLLVPHVLQKQAIDVARRVAESLVVGDPRAPATDLGPVISRRQFDHIQRLIQAGIDEGARLVTGGVGKPPGLERGHYVRPTIFADVRNEMRIAREEIFGPVLAILPYADEGEAVALANDTPYGLAAYVSGSDLAQLHGVAGQLQAGMVHLNDAPMELNAPFGGYKQSGNGREWGEFGLEAFVELKAVLGYTPAAGG